MVANDTNAGRQTIALLVVADTWCDTRSACAAVWHALEQRNGTVYVVSPALTSRLQSLASDIDQSLTDAQRRLDGVLTQLREHGYVASGRVGDENPAVAIDDALLDHQAEEILIVTTAATGENWRERKLFERATGLGLPVTCVRVAKAVIE